ncbi:hypothetical protein QBC33DRAFT_469436 [Phialemonium atrogriseum]|uniref:N-acetyltransferase domain-containing protein n=1 Tax=Phialemonium atrogriseum TaxID=1093897 RepID=A0AAJ0FND9_9PEZI|nr:uncharacterized protein QBC33DRAFT_469436 [Phialemonium atrogriseum]KAK1768899.1 hypothetical protein QBC33DRAFT_469436 [Phialemonium atrogriseum]
MTLSPSDVVFAEATPEQQRRAWELNGVSWAPPLSLPDYLEREKHLSQQELARDGGCKYWVLHLKSDPSTIVASCETTRKPVLIAGAPGEPVRRGVGYGIASVYTDPAYRRQGMATLMLAKVQEFLDREADCSALYSDIGRHYYGNLGWPAFPSDQATLHLEPPSPAEPGPDSGLQPFVPSDPPATRPLARSDLPPLCAADEALLESRLGAPLPAGGGGAGMARVAFVPSFAQISWQLAREDFMARKLFGVSVERRGAVTADGKAWVVWDHDWREKKLKVMRLVATHDGGGEAGERIAALKALLEAALAEASAWGLQKVLVWNPDGEVTVACKAVGNAHEDSVKLVLDERLDGSIPSFRWRGEDKRDTIWEDNYYYCWC